MSSVLDLHQQAMDLADRAISAVKQGDSDQANRLFRTAFEKERQAAERFAQNLEAEPTRSILYRSAASLALDCDELRQSEKLIAVALAGNPPNEIAEELRDLLEQVNFKRHLDLRGVVLAPGEFQLSIAGSSIGEGWALSEAFTSRVKTAEKLIYRTAERLLGYSFRDHGEASKAIRNNFALFLSAPRIGSLAVTFKLGRQKDPVLPGLEDHMGKDYTSEVVEEVAECLGLINDSNEDALRERINDGDYYRSFVGLARQMAPDGEEVNLVGFTSMAAGKEKRVALTKPSTNILMRAQDVGSSKVKESETVRIIGRLLYANSLSSTLSIFRVARCR